MDISKHRKKRRIKRNVVEKALEELQKEIDVVRLHNGKIVQINTLRLQTLKYEV